MLPAAAPPAVYAGVREIATTGTLQRELAPGRYDVSESYAAARWQGRIAALRGTITYTAHVPAADGVFLSSATVDQQEQVDPDGSVRLLSYRRVTQAVRVQHTAVFDVRSSVDERTLELSFPSGETMIPSSLAPHREALALAATLHRSESDTAPMVLGGGTITMRSRIDRTTSADGSFDETGYLTEPSMHRIHQEADGSANARDQVPGFSLRELTVAPPVGVGSAAHVGVTLKTQGRTVGPTPIDTHDYVVPLWYAATWPVPLATATLTVEPPRPPDARCSLGPARLTPVVVAWRHVDVTGEIAEEREERDLDGTRRVLCHLTSMIARRFDVTAGYETGSIADTTVLHMTGPPSRTLTNGPS